LRKYWLFKDGYMALFGRKGKNGGRREKRKEEGRNFFKLLQREL